MGTLFIYLFILRGGIGILSSSILPGMAVMITEGLWGGLILSVVPELCGMKLGGMLHRVQGTGYKVKRPGVES